MLTSKGLNWEWSISVKQQEKCKVKSVKVSVPLPVDPLEEDDMANHSKDDYRQTIETQKKRIKALEKALEFSRLETRARDMMIDKAEEYFDIPIRKKSGAK